MDWQAFRDAVTPIVVPLGGIMALIGGCLSIYYNSTSNRILLKRYRREEEAKEVDARADELRRRAHETAVSEGGSTMRMITFELTNEIDRKAAWKLCKDGHARMQGDRITIDVDLLPPMIARDMARRAALRSTDNFH